MVIANPVPSELHGRPFMRLEARLIKCIKGRKVDTSRASSRSTVG